MPDRPAALDDDQHAGQPGGDALAGIGSFGLSLWFMSLWVKAVTTQASPQVALAPGRAGRVVN